MANLPLVNSKYKILFKDVISFRYKTYKHDPNPTIIYFATVKSKDGSKFMTGLNLNYMKSFKDQTLLLKVIYNFDDPKKAYEHIKKYRLFKHLYRTYREENIVSAKKFDLSLLQQMWQ